MASNSIQIYNDTVLKQSVLQGFQEQRTNENLGKFTMGEIAFTRDTGRLFVGNFTNNKHTKDSSQITGGILSGNKYLGLIDSKPLLHFSASGSTGWKPLSYEENITDSITEETEVGVFCKGSRFRQDDDNGWDKKPQYIEKYGVYSGDYVFDIYNNALILFDKNITTNELEQPQRRIVDGKEQYLDSSTGLPLSIMEQKRRTKISNVQNQTLSEHPVYGQGYVIMRILEPDGVTIGYKDRTYKDKNGNPLTDGAATTIDANESHNYLQVKNVPASSLEASFAENQFENDNGKIKLKSEISGVSKITAPSLTLPKTISFSGLKFTFNNSAVNVTNPSSDKILTLRQENGSYNVRVSQQYQPTFMIYLNDGLINSKTGESFIKLSRETSLANELAIGFNSNSTSSTSSNSSRGYSNPFFITSASSYLYNGTGCYSSSGSLNYTEYYDEDYANLAKQKIEKYDSTHNVALNYLKNPLPICWTLPNSEKLSDFTTSVKLDFITYPYFFCIKKDYTKEFDQETKEDDYTSSFVVLGNNTYEESQQSSHIPLIDGYSFEPYDNEMYNSFILGNTDKYKTICQEKLDFKIDNPFVPFTLNNLIATETINGVNYEVYTYVGAAEQNVSGQNISIPTQIYKNGESYFFEHNNSLIKITSDLNSSQIFPNYSAQEMLLNGKDKESYGTEIDNWINSITTLNLPYKMSNADCTVQDGILTLNDDVSTRSILLTLNLDGNGNFYYKKGFNDKVDLSNLIQNNEYITKIQISKNSSSESDRFITLFDSDLASKYNENSITVMDGSGSVILYNSTIYGDKIFEVLMQSDPFINSSYTPYFLKIESEIFDIDEQKTISKTNLVKLSDVINYNTIRDDISKNLVGAFGINSTTTEKISLDDYYNQKFLIDAITQSGFDAIYLFYKKENSVTIPIETKIKFGEALYTTQVETTIGIITFRATGITDIEDNNFIIEKVNLKSPSKQLLWSNADDREDIKELINLGEINIPTMFNVYYESVYPKTFLVKETLTMKKGYNYSTNAFFNDEKNKVVIPAHASSVLLQVHNLLNNNDGSYVSIFTSKDFLSLNSQDANYSFPFNITKSDDLSNLPVPSLLPDCNFNENQKLIYNQNTSGCKVIEVPLYKTPHDNAKGCSLRIANIKCGNTFDKFLIRLIGYRV